MLTPVLRRQRQRDRAPREAVLSLPEAIWIPEQWEKEDESPSPEERHPQERTTTDPQTQGTSSATEEETAVAPADRTSSPVQDTSKPKPKPHKRKYYSKDECSICLGSFERGDVIRILPCGHLFHKTEVDDWLVKWKKVVSRYWKRVVHIVDGRYFTVSCLQNVRLPSDGPVSLWLTSRLIQGYHSSPNDRHPCPPRRNGNDTPRSASASTIGLADWEGIGFSSGPGRCVGLVTAAETSQKGLEWRGAWRGDAVVGLIGRAIAPSPGV